VRERDPFPGWGAITMVGWAGMRGVVSLALALAIPARVAGGPFPQRNLVVFLAFSVIVVTLVGQGLTLPMVIRRLGVVADDEGTARDASGGVQKYPGTDRGPAAPEDRAIRQDIEDD
jgi:NhaP-type Na+/H+ or K+/H+ antiporter